ncbi:MAG: MucR family transcriptional regulator [Desulfuromonadales bacterium]|nr:MucR family transcriptional regulator [Desulfuromonadales bacterium]
MSNLTELTAQIITARAAKKEMSTEEFQKEMQMVYSFLKDIEAGNNPETASVQEPEEVKPQKINFKKIFKDDEVICLLCNKGFKALKRHLTQAHHITDKEYRAQFNIPKTQPLIAKNYSDERKKAALDRGQGELMARARAAKKAASAGASVKPAKAAK